MHIPKFFSKRFDRLGLKPNLQAFLIEELTAPHRHYHNLGHIALMIRSLEERAFKTTSYHFPELILAALFHDIVYDATRSDNEEASAATYRIWMSGTDFDHNWVEDLILRTKTHDLRTTSSDICLFLLADLEILWSPPTTYAWYARGVRKEYAHVPAQAYRDGRAKVLDHLHEKIKSPNISPLCERLFTTNIHWEKNHLISGALDV
jgi:predicted metal-dependent HD superfamily phosphohydrolase